MQRERRERCFADPGPPKIRNFVRPRIAYLATARGRPLRMLYSRECRLTEAAMAHERIDMNPEIMGGKPVVRGTRIPVETVLRKLGAGVTADAILADHPRLTREDILAAQA